MSLNEAESRHLLYSSTLCPKPSNKKSNLRSRKSLTGISEGYRIADLSAHVGRCSEHPVENTTKIASATPFFPQLLLPGQGQGQGNKDILLSCLRRAAAT